VTVTLPGRGDHNFCDDLNEFKRVIGKKMRRMNMDDQGKLNISHAVSIAPDKPQRYRKPKPVSAPVVQRIFSVEIIDAIEIHAAIVRESLDLSCAPINLQNLKRFVMASTTGMTPEQTQKWGWMRGLEITQDDRLGGEND